MKKSWNQWNQRVNEMSQRERGAILVLMVVAIVMAADFLLISPSFERTKLAAAEQFKLSLEEKSLQKELKQIDIDNSGVEFNERLRLRTAEYENAIVPLVEQAKKQLLAPERVAEFLEDLLPSGGPVKLSALKSFEPKTDAKQQGLYRHPFVAEFKGPYVDLMAQLERIESSPWKLVVESMSVEVDDKQRPEVTLKIQIVALSDSPNWLSKTVATPVKANK